jgi:hypothetical protein
MTITDEILVLANRLANDGNKPTLALIKGKLSTKVPIPTIITTLKGWQHDPSFIDFPENKAVNIETPKSAEADELRVVLNEELAQMKQEIYELKVLIKELLSQQKKN